MTPSIQPGQKQGSVPGRLAVDFKGIGLQSLHPEDRRAVPPSERMAPPTMKTHTPVRLCLGAAIALLLAAAPALAQARKQLAPEAPPQRVQPQEGRDAFLDRCAQATQGSGRD